MVNASKPANAPWFRKFKARKVTLAVPLYKLEKLWVECDRLGLGPVLKQNFVVGKNGSPPTVYLAVIIPDGRHDEFRENVFAPHGAMCTEEKAINLVCPS